MGSINDYLRSHHHHEEKSRGSKFKNRLLGQIALSLVLFLIISASVGVDNFFGESARYVVGDGISQESSWIDFENSQIDDPEAIPPEEDTSTQVSVFPADDGAQPDFTAPASGIVVTDIAVAAGGFATTKGILIQGNAGQAIKAAATGIVESLGESEDGYIIELTHSGGFSSVYQGLSELHIQEGEQVTVSDPIGVSQDGEITFSLLLNNEEVNPLDYLFE